MIIYHLLPFLNPVQHPGERAGMKTQGYPRDSPSTSAPQSNCLTQPVASLSPAWE